MASRFWFVCHFSVAGLSQEILARREKFPVVDQSGHGHSRSQDAHVPNHCQCFDAKTVTPTFVSTSVIQEFPWIQRGVDLQVQQSHVAADTPSINFGISTVDRIMIKVARVIRLCCHLINNYCFRFSERRPEMHWLSEDSKLLRELGDQQIVSRKP